MPSKPVKTNTETQPFTVEATSNNSIPDYYRYELPAEHGRASITVEYEDGKASAQMSLPSKQLSNATGLIVGLSAIVVTPATLAIASHAGLSATACMAVTAMAAGVSVLAFVWLFFMLHIARCSQLE
ncbi:hypothetical protein [Nocardia wallacei]|uniref:hypothetical protein n=1 Tax=Nocardia wallacei TaxID=480035 RepID=UPI0024564768|nr:hypothetical protein [Nocardia wallacei]